MSTFAPIYKITIPLFDAVAINLFGITLAQAHSERICIRCKLSTPCLLTNKYILQRYKRTGLCPKCYSELTQDEEN